MDAKEFLIDLLIHDLTGPLSIASTSIGNLLNKQDGYGPVTDRQKKTLKMALRNVKKAQTFLEEMIEIYRCEEALFKKGPCSIQTILRGALLEAVETTDPNAAENLYCDEGFEEFRRLLEERGVFIDVEGKYATSPFYHDAKKLQQILRNLITNALKYRRERIRIIISGDTDLIITVEDDGCGIPVDNHACVFERFSRFKTPGGADNEIKGLGFGLSCVKTIVEMMSGNISLSSKEGLGTCFTVRIPPL